MRIMQISDSHISSENRSRTTDLETCIELINAATPQPDAVIHTGDVAHDGRAEEYATARRLLDGLKAPYFVIPGNRDNRSGLIRAFADGIHIRPEMDFVQYSVERFGVRLIFIDTASTTSNKGSFCRARLGHLDEMLAADTTRPAALFLHHPPFEVRAIPDPIQFESWAEVEALTACIARYDQVRGVFCGHVHRNVEAVIGPIPAITVSCIATDLRKGVPAAPASQPTFPVTGSIPSRLHTIA